MIFIIIMDIGFEFPQLNPLIAEHVAAHTVVISDGWVAYGGIERLANQFTHRWVNHRINFLNPADADVHTQGQYNL